MTQNIKFAPSPIHGTGVFALVDIAPGTQIMKEKALWAIDRATAINASIPTYDNVAGMRDIMIQSLRRSNPHYPHDQKSVQGMLHRSKILYLCGGFASDEEKPTPEDPERFMRILTERLRQVLILNAYAEGPDQGPVERVGVFEGGSRINHSCAPNAERITTTKENGDFASVVTTNTAIKKGDEILVSYIERFATTLERQKALQSRWKFTCACKLCSRPKRQIDASDLRRMEMSRAIELLIQYDNIQTDDTAVDDAAVNVWKDLDALAVKEGIIDLKLFHLLHIASDAARRMQKFSYQVELLHRMRAVAKTFDFSREIQQTIRDRIEDSPRLAQEAMAKALEQSTGS